MRNASENTSMRIVHWDYVSCGVSPQRERFYLHYVIVAFPVMPPYPIELLTYKIQSVHPLLLTRPLQSWVRTYYFQDGRQSEGDVNTNGDADIGGWTEGLSGKHCLEGSRIHPMLVKAWAIDGECISSPWREQRLWEECQGWGLGNVIAQRDNRGYERSR